MTTASLPPPNGIETELVNQDTSSKARLPTKASRQRFKPQLSCTLCRARKLKCDRAVPCENCTKRDLASSCTYIHAGIREKPSLGSSIQKTSTASTGPKDVQSRVRHLEELVVSLMHQNTLKTPAPQPQVSLQPGQTSGTDIERSQAQSIAEKPRERSDFRDLRGTSDSFGRISIEDEKPNYVGAAHWAAILDSIAALKDSLEDNQTQEAREPAPIAIPAVQGPELLAGGIPKATKAEILAALPPRPVADLLVKRFYRTPDFTSFIHVPTLQREYENFWAGPGDTPVMWIGLLFAIMSSSLNIELLDEGKASSLEGQALKDPQEVIKIFREKTVQCLVLGNYTEPTAHTVETLFMYFLSEHFRNSESHIGAWMVCGLIVRSAMRLGYHRDPSHSPNISVFRGEMQRRIWASVIHMDLQTSCRVGLPRMVKDGMFDTQPPRNLLDTDFDENTSVLPPSRPFSTPTTLTHSLVKEAILMVYGKIVDQTSSTNTMSYDDTMKLDSQLHEAYQQVPEFWKVHSIEDLKVSSGDLMIAKFLIHLSYQRARCVLHRKYLVPTKLPNASRYSYSVKECVDAAMRILQSQTFIFEQSQPNNTLCNHKWKLSSLQTHDFLLAAMLVCVYLNQGVTNTSFNMVASVNGVPIQSTRSEMLHTLDGSYRIWDEARHTSKDALKAAKALKRTLSRVRGAGLETGSNLQESPASQTSASASYITSCSERVLPIGHTSSNSSETTSNAPPGVSNFAIPQSRQPAEQGAFEPLYVGTDDMINPNMELDWELWDSHFHNNSDGSLPDLWNFDGNTFAFPAHEDDIME